jgi:DNA topoisomerase-6 subunit B
MAKRTSKASGKGKSTGKTSKRTTAKGKSAKKATSAKRAASKSSGRSKKRSSSVDGQLSLLPPMDELDVEEALQDPSKPIQQTGSQDRGEDESQTRKQRAGKKSRKSRYATAEAMSKAQRDISVSEFFAKNRHLLGFDNPRKALLTTVKEAVDNALDACEEAGILPEVMVQIEQIDEDHYRVGIEDNGPGIMKQQIPNIFGRLLYGSKFHRLRMSRGQQGIGISAAGMYGLLTTGKPVRITSKTKRGKAHHYELKIDTQKNRPDIMKDEQVEWDKSHGTKVVIELEARYQRGRQSVDEYLRQTAIANPHVGLHYTAPDGQEMHYPSTIGELPDTPREIKPHPHGVELGVLIKMIHDTNASTMQQFFTKEFSRVSPKVAKEICHTAAKNKICDGTLTERTHPNWITGNMAKALYQAIQNTKILAPSTDCVVPIGEEQLVEGLKQVVDAGFYVASTRKPAVYRGNPFIIEAALAYGKPESKSEKAERIEQEIEAEIAGEDNDDDNSLAKVVRFANRVPLQYQQGACAITKSVVGMNWRGYGLQQSRGALPSGELSIVVHMASVWVPFTSESKEAIASYPEVLKEIRLALQDCGRKLGQHIRKAHRLRQELKKRSYIEKYIPAIGEALRDILDLKDKQVVSVCDNLKDVLERSRKM